MTDPKRTFPPDHDGLHNASTIAFLKREPDGTEVILHFEEAGPYDHDHATLIGPVLLRDLMRRANAGVKAAALLRKLEWASWDGNYGSGAPTCPSCKGEQSDGHTSDCELAAFLRALGDPI